MTERVWLDFETFSAAKIRDTGSSRYVEDSTTEPVCLGYAIDDGPVKVWVDSRYLKLPDGFDLISKCECLIESDEIPDDLRQALAHDAEVWAHNAEFDLAVWEKFYGDQLPLPIDRWRDSAALCAFFALPRSLDGATSARRQRHLKDPRGKRLINKLCKPRKPTKNNPSTRWMLEDCPADYDDLFLYCAADVSAMRELVMNLPETRLPKLEQDVWVLTTQGNLAGLPVDVDEVRAMTELISEYEAKCLIEIDKLTDGAVQKAGSTKKIIAWLAEQGVEVPNLQKSTVADLQKTTLPPKVERFLDIRGQVGRISTKKYFAILDRVCADGTVKNNVVFWGAGPGRFAGRGFQIQNVPRLATVKMSDVNDDPLAFDDAYNTAWDLLNEGVPAIELVYKNFMEYSSGMVRSSIKAPPGYEFVSGDYSSIENRLILWCAGEAEALEKFRRGMDQYKDFAYQHHKVPYDEVTPEQRFDAKAIVLGCGFGMGAEKFKDTCDKKGTPITLEKATDGVNAFRSIYPLVPDFWYTCASVARKAVKNRNRIYWYESEFMKLGFESAGDWLTMQLPSGRKIRYYKPVIKTRRAPWVDFNGDHPIVPQLMHMGLNLAKQWTLIPLIPGRIAENAVQGTGRDIMIEGMKIAEDEGYPVLTTIHDEVLSLVKKGVGDVDEFCKLICPQLPWLEGFPLVAEGWKGERYRK